MLVDDKLTPIKSPLNYIGGKTKLLKQILPLFPNQIDNFVDLFAGGLTVGLNVNANKIYCNDNLHFIIELFVEFKNVDLVEIIEHIEKRIETYDLSETNNQGYLDFRKYYNKTKNPLDLFVLIAYSFNHQIRFNSKHEFNNPFGKNRSRFNQKMKENLILFIKKIKSSKIEFSSHCFTEFDYSFLTSDDFVYCDPPYIITTGSYNDGKRGFKGWGDDEENELLNKLVELDKKGIRFALSNVLKHKNKSNSILKNWLSNHKNFNIHHLNMNYSNSNYQSKKEKNQITLEVLITNY